MDDFLALFRAPSRKELNKGIRSYINADEYRRIAQNQDDADLSMMVRWAQGLLTHINLSLWDAYCILSWVGATDIRASYSIVDAERFQNSTEVPIPMPSRDVDYEIWVAAVEDTAVSMWVTQHEWEIQNGGAFDISRLVTAEAVAA